MRFLQNASIQRKQMLVIMLTSTVALLLACTGFVTYEVGAFRREMIENLSTLADVIGNNSSGALDFNDPKAAQEMLSALRAEPEIVAACIYTKSGEPFATYHRGGVSGDFAPPKIEPESSQFTSRGLFLYHRITQGGRKPFFRDSLDRNHNDCSRSR